MFNNFYFILKLVVSKFRENFKNISKSKFVLKLFFLLYVKTIFNRLLLIFT